MLTVDIASVALGSASVLDGVSLSARRGEFICLLGPNGAGKTTLLRAIAGLLSFEGAVRIDGYSIIEIPVPQLARTIAYLPQAGGVHWPLRVWDVVAIGRLPFSSSLTNLDEADRKAIDAALTDVDALGFRDRLVTELSGGERARVLLARALAVDSPMLLLDEPIAALDPAHQLSTLGLLRAHAERGRLVIAAIHDLALAARFASRVLILADGRVAADGLPYDVMTADIISEVFRIQTIFAEHDGLRVPVVWQAGSEVRDN